MAHGAFEGLLEVALYYTEDSQDHDFREQLHQKHPHFVSQCLAKLISFEFDLNFVDSCLVFHHCTCASTGFCCARPVHAWGFQRRKDLRIGHGRVMNVCRQF